MEEEHQSKEQYLTLVRFRDAGCIPFTYLLLGLARMRLACSRGVRWVVSGKVNTGEYGTIECVTRLGLVIPVEEDLSHQGARWGAAFTRSSAASKPGSFGGSISLTTRSSGNSSPSLGSSQSIAHHGTGVGSLSQYHSPKSVSR